MQIPEATLKSLLRLLFTPARFQIAKRTKSKNRMQITEFPARLGQQERFLREIQGM